MILTTIWINFKNHKNKKFLNLFCILFIASVLNPLFFILISNKACVFYHFNNLIIITGILFFIFFVMIYLEKFFNSLLLIKFDKIINLSLILFLCFSFYSSNLNNFEDINHKTSRKEFNNVTKKIRSIDKIENISILTFDTDFMIWAIMNDIKYLSLINGLFSSKTDRMIEEDIFSAFKVLNLSTENFNKFLNNENDKSSWRYLNLNISTFFFYKYQANSMITFKNMKEFTDEELKFLKRSSPILHQQSIIPKLELERLKNEFENFMNLDPNPDILILNVNDNFYEMRELNLINYCLEYKGQNYFLYKQKNKYKCQEIN